MSTFTELVDQLGAAVGEQRAPRLEYVERRPRGFDKHTLQQVERDLERWAAEGNAHAAEALQLLKERE